MGILLGLILLCLLVLGAALFLLALVFLAISVGLQLLNLTTGGAPWVPALATNVQLAAGSAFALGVVLVAIGLTAFLSPAVRAFLKGLVLLFRLALSPAFIEMIHRLPQMLRQAAVILDLSGRFLISPTNPSQVTDPPDPSNHPLTVAGNNLNNASAQFPAVPAITTERKPLWLKINRVDGHDEYAEGYVPKPPLAPNDVQIVTSVSTGAAQISVVTTALSNVGSLFHDAGQNAVGVGTHMRQTAETLNIGADLIEQALQ